MKEKQLQISEFVTGFEIKEVSACSEIKITDALTEVIFDLWQTVKNFGKQNENIIVYVKYGLRAVIIETNLIFTPYFLVIGDVLFPQTITEPELQKMFKDKYSDLTFDLLKMENNILIVWDKRISSQDLQEIIPEFLS